MGIAEIIVAVISAYLEREKARQDEDRAMQIIRDINNSVLNNKENIYDALDDWEISTLTGKYIGLVQNFKEYEPRDDQKINLERLAYDTNAELLGPLISMYDRVSDVIRVRKVVNLMVLTLGLRGLVLSELKMRYGDNRDANLLEQLEAARGCCKGVIDRQDEEYFKPTLSIWRQCETGQPGGGAQCIPTGDSDPMYGHPTTCCIGQYNEYKPQRELLDEDRDRMQQVEEAINHLRGSFQLDSIASETRP